MVDISLILMNPAGGGYCSQHPSEGTWSCCTQQTLFQAALDYHPMVRLFYVFLMVPGWRWSSGANSSSCVILSNIRWFGWGNKKGKFNSRRIRWMKPLVRHLLAALQALTSWRVMHCSTAKKGGRSGFYGGPVKNSRSHSSSSTSSPTCLWPKTACRLHNDLKDGWPGDSAEDAETKASMLPVCVREVPTAGNKPILNLRTLSILCSVL